MALKEEVMGHLGFSYLGLIFLLMLFVPNIIWTKHKPAGYEDIVGKEKGILPILERAGQVCVTCCALIFKDFNLPDAFSLWSLWLVATIILMLLYELSWIRYFTGEHTLESFYGNLWIIPVPLASLPVTAFLLLGIYGKVIWLVVSVIILGIGHIGIHIQHLRELRQ